METVSLAYTASSQGYDVIVLGGGTAGVMAACAAAREHKRALLIEREYALGGTATLSLTLPRMTHHVPGFMENGSLSAQVQSRMEADGFAADGYFAHPEMAKVYLERLCGEYGVEILYGADLVAPLREGAHLEAVVVNTSAGAVAYRAKAFIDCTGNAQLAFLCGCETECGQDGENQPMTLRFAAGGVDVAKVERTLNAWGYRFGGDHFPMEFYSLWREEDFNPLTKLLRQGVTEGALTERDGSYVQVFYHPALGESTLWFNCPEAGHIRDAVSAPSITEMVLYSRESAMRILSFFAKRFPGFEKAAIQSFASIPGIRESRRIVGEYVLTGDDLRARRRFEDAVAQSAYPVDIHSEKNLTLIHFAPGEYYEIPYRCLQPKEMDNLLVAGRCLSASFEAQSSARIQLTCMALGEAAGIAAALSPDVKRIDGADVRRKMQEYGGCFL